MRKTFIYQVVLWCICQPVVLYAQVNAGKVISYTKVTGGISGKTEHALFDIHAYNDNIIRVRVTQNSTFNTVNYALENGAIPSFSAQVTDKGTSIEISTAAATAVVEKSPLFRVTFKNKSGEVINEDETGSAFGTAFYGNKVTSYKKLQEGEHFVGLGEAPGNLDKRGSAYTLNNTDTYGYGDPRLPMYISIPFYIGIHHRHTYGIFYNNTFKTFFNFGSSAPFVSVTADGGDADYFFFYDSTVPKILEHYSSITGRMPLPPAWSLGYQQSRCSYFPQSKVEWLAETFRQKKIPIDGIVLDADYQYNYQPFRTDKGRFPDLPALSAKLAALNINLTASVYPGVQIDSTYESYTDGLKQDVFVKYTDGGLFKTEITPSKILLPDYTNPKTRSWWIDKMKWMQENNVSGYWNDMNEPAVGGSYLPDNLQFDFDGRKASAAEAKNVYGFLMARSSYEAALKYRANKRPFILTRAAFAGVQRYSCVWSGDNTASDEGLQLSVLLNSQMSLSGIPFVGPDLGGYIGDGSKDLFKRWMEVGVFSPYVRNHKEYFATANEPWSYGEEAEAISKTYIGFRYRLMPYIYSAFYEASQKGMPVAKSLCINYPFDDKVYDVAYQYQFLFGNALMVATVTGKERSKKIYLPANEWYDLFTDELIDGGSEIQKAVPVYQVPVFVKASSIIPMQGLVQSTREKPTDTLFVHIYNGKSRNQFVYYEDAGDGFEYKEGVYCKRIIEFDPAAKKIIAGRQEGSFISKFTRLQFILHGFEDSLKQVYSGNDAIKMISGENNAVLDPLENLLGIYDPDYYKGLKKAPAQAVTKSFVIHNSAGPVEIKW